MQIDKIFSQIEKGGISFERIPSLNKIFIKDNMAIKVHNDIELGEREYIIMKDLQNCGLSTPPIIAFRKNKVSALFMKYIKGTNLFEINYEEWLDKYVNYIIQFHDQKMNTALIEKCSNSQDYLLKRLNKKFKRNIKIFCNFDFNLNLLKNVIKLVASQKKGLFFDRTPRNTILYENKLYAVDFERVRDSPFLFDLANGLSMIAVPDKRKIELFKEYTKKKNKVGTIEQFFATIIYRALINYGVFVALINIYGKDYSRKRALICLKNAYDGAIFLEENRLAYELKELIENVRD